MFNFIKKKLEVVSPFDGMVVDVTDIKDPVFSQKMMGDGIGLIPTSDEIRSPIDGIVEVVAPTKHAVVVKSAEGIEIIVHYGIDTVKYQGKGFEFVVKEKDIVNKGDLLFKCNSGLFKKENVDLSSPILLIDGTNYQVIDKQIGKTVKTGELIYRVIKK